MKSVLAGIAALPLLAAAAQDPRPARVDALFADIGADAPGCTVGVYRNGQAILTRAYGVANVEDGRRLTPRTNFNLGSAAKPYTALAALMLEERGRLSLDDRIRRYLPELPEYAGSIRVRDLLQHTSGFRDWQTLELFSGRPVNTMPEFLGLMLRQQRLNFEPATRHEYSHSDFLLLSLIIERVVREPFGAFLEREVLQPMGMTASRVHDARGARVPERAFGHRRTDAGTAVIYSESQTTGGENLYASVQDLAHWDRMLDEAASGRRPLVERMLTRPVMANGDVVPYAFGVRQGRHRGLRTISRSGHPPGVMADFVRFPDHRLAVATLCNSEGLYAGPRGMKVAEIYLGDQMEPASALAPVPPEASMMPSDVHRYVGTYKSEEAFDHARFGVVNGKLAEFLIDTHQTMTYRGGGWFTGDGSPGDFRLLFTPTTAPGGMRLQYFSEGQPAGTFDRMADADRWRPTAAALAEFAGLYFSEELNLSWQLAERDGDLVIRRPATTDALLHPMEPDVFSRGFGAWNEPLVARFTFTRDANRRVTHFSVTTPPGADVVRDLVFTRLKTQGDR